MFAKQCLSIRPESSDAAAESSDCIGLPVDGAMSFDAMEKLNIDAALNSNGINVMATARRLGKTHETLGSRTERRGLGQGTTLA